MIRQCQIVGMTFTEFRDLLKRVGLDFPTFRKLTGLSRSGAYGMGRDWNVPQYAITLAEAWYLMDGPTRDKLLKAIED